MGNFKTGMLAYTVEYCFSDGGIYCLGRGNSQSFSRRGAS